VVVFQEGGKPYIIQRINRARIRVIADELGLGPLRRREVKEAATDLTDGEAVLIVVGEATIENGFDTLVDGAAKVAKRHLDVTTDEIADGLKQAFSSS
jgi:hypothetical protein